MTLRLRAAECSGAGHWSPLSRVRMCNGRPEQNNAGVLPRTDSIPFIPPDFTFSHRQQHRAFLPSIHTIYHAVQENKRSTDWICCNTCTQQLAPAWLLRPGSRAGAMWRHAQLDCLLPSQRRTTDAATGCTRAVRTWMMQRLPFQGCSQPCSDSNQ